MMKIQCFPFFFVFVAGTFMLMCWANLRNKRVSFTLTVNKGEKCIVINIREENVNGKSTKITRFQKKSAKNLNIFL